ncbi:hypothetical protein P3T73_13820 [Kiritimatiellota bacterium B12222]|nr:hypothetical protein P3T73_13820 [Kiritimatiellota bacterium B12222]
MDESDYPSREAYVEARLAFLRKRLKDLGECGFYNAPGMDPEMELAFLEQVYAIEAEPCITYAHQLISKGVELPPPNVLDDECLHLKVWEVIHALSELRVFLENTGHLSDRELYQKLWSDSLNEFTWDMSHCCNGAMHLDLLGSGSEEDTRIWLAYYADDMQREEWLEQFPDEELPDQKKLACDRDQHLPQPDYGLGETDDF